MNKKKFNQWFLVLIAFVVAVLGSIYFSVTPRNAASLKALNNPAETAQEVVAADPDIVDEVDKIEPDKTADDELAALMDELTPHQYHADPFIEARTVMGLYSHCGRVSKHESLVELRLIENNHAQVANDYLKYCADARLRYPSLLNSADVYQKVKQISANSELGKLLEQDYIEQGIINEEHFQLTQTKKLKEVLNAGNSVLLAESSLEFFILQFGEILPLSQWLGSQDVDYNYMVNRYALSRMACRYQPSSVCGPIGVVSLMFCYEDQALCGLDFETIYGMSVMPGMKKDVELLVSHLDEFAKSN